MAQEARFDDDLTGYAIAVTRGDDGWRVEELSESAFDGLDDAVSQVRALRSEGPSFGVVNVDNEYFVLVRPSPTGTRAMVSDATMAVMDDLAADVLELLNIDIPDVDPEGIDDIEPWSEGDLGLLEDLGLQADVLQVIVDDEDMWPDEQIHAIAEGMGFVDELERVVG